MSMSSRRFGALVLLISTLLASAMSAVTGCSDDGKASSADASTEGAARDAPRPEPENDATLTTCREDCQAAHASGVPKDEAINACWETYCRGPCVDGQPSEAGVLADGAAPDGGTCTSPVITISLSCDECTNTFCCAAWDACFQDPTCTNLNACYQGCAE